MVVHADNLYSNNCYADYRNYTYLLLLGLASTYTTNSEAAGQGIGKYYFSYLLN